jgi:hypothetical protein
MRLPQLPVIEEVAMDLLVRATRYPDWDAGVAFAARLAGQLRTGFTGAATWCRVAFPRCGNTTRVAPG